MWRSCCCSWNLDKFAALPTALPGSADDVWLLRCAAPHWLSLSAFAQRLCAISLTRHMALVRACDRLVSFNNAARAVHLLRQLGALRAAARRIARLLLASARRRPPLLVHVTAHCHCCGCISCHFWCISSGMSFSFECTSISICISACISSLLIHELIHSVLGRNRRVLAPVSAMD